MPCAPFVPIVPCATCGPAAPVGPRVFKIGRLVVLEVGITFVLLETREM